MRTLPVNPSSPSIYQCSSARYMRYFRTCEDVQKDLIMPFLGFGVQPGTEVRMTAVMEVLRRLPKKDYRTLKRKTDDDEFQWFIPIYECLGGVYPFPANVFNDNEKAPVGLELNPYAKVIFSSPRLEEIDFGIAVAVVAHELAHIVLGHKIRVQAKPARSKRSLLGTKLLSGDLQKKRKNIKVLVLEAMKGEKEM